MNLLDNQYSYILLVWKSPVENSPLFKFSHFYFLINIVSVKQFSVFKSVLEMKNCAMQFFQKFWLQIKARMIAIFDLNSMIALI